MNHCPPIPALATIRVQEAAVTLADSMRELQVDLLTSLYEYTKRTGLPVVAVHVICRPIAYGNGCHYEVGIRVRMK